MQKISTHEAYNDLKSILTADNDTKVTFLDFSKAYNSIDCDLLLRLMKPKLDDKTYACIEKIIQSQNIKTFKRYLSCKNGLPQG